MNPLSQGVLAALALAYASAARRVRRRARSRPDLLRSLRRPVVSVGNIAVGGRSKTPVVAALAELLRDSGERPAILSRGYAREHRADGVVVVRTPERIEATLAGAGDEPLMLARALDGVAVLVAEDRHAAGALAESRLGCTVHLLDDGFQHFRLRRDVDLVLVTPADLAEGRPLPRGWLREPVDAARHASALLVVEGDAASVERVARRLDITRRFTVLRRLTVPRMLEPAGAPPRHPRAAPTLAVAGIARPERFFDDLQAGGWNLVDRIAFPDHHRYTAADAAHVASRARAGGAAVVLTTAKDFVRWEPLSPLPFPLAWVPMEVAIEPADAFASWLLGAIRRAAAARDDATVPR